MKRNYVRLNKNGSFDTIKTLIHEQLINKYNQLALCKQETATNNECVSTCQTYRNYENTTQRFYSELFTFSSLVSMVTFIIVFCFDNRIMSLLH